ncbi:MAG: CHAT domain-containing protein [Acidobacteria bacterium]|nr:CHAT domain-containing protein [Acidobacteriota bacterium]
MGEYQEALNVLRQALPVHRAAGDRITEVATLYTMARTERELDHLTQARAQIEIALGIVESLRTKAPGQDLRASYLGSKRDHYEFYIDLLMRLHQREPSEGHDAMALQASERARARSLLETLIEARADIRQGVDAALLKRERALQQQLNAKEQSRMQLLSGQHTEEQAAAAEKELRELLTQYQEVQAQIRTTSPRYAALTQPQPLSLKEIQQQALDDDTLLLEYTLGEERSYLWAVTPTSINSFELPKRAEIEAAAQQVYELMTKSKERAARSQLALSGARLSQMLLGSVANQLGMKRLLIVSDGALQYVPFAALPASGMRSAECGMRIDQSKLQTPNSKMGCPLIAEHEIISLPSASVLAVLRRELAGRQPVAKLVAVLADPVFEKTDPRVKSQEPRAKTFHLIRNPCLSTGRLQSACLSTDTAIRNQ